VRMEQPLGMCRKNLTCVNNMVCEMDGVIRMLGSGFGGGAGVCVCVDVSGGFGGVYNMN
jgi:hypothetical protein